jgi:hypothetical protein
MDCYNVIKQIIPGVFISDFNINNCADKLNFYNINYVINVNNVLINKTTTSYNISVNSNNDYYDNSELIKINFNQTNDFIINSLQNKSNILICDNSYNIPLLIVGAFLIKYLNMSFTETIYWISKKTNSQGISKNVCHCLFLYFMEEND